MLDVRIPALPPHAKGAVSPSALSILEALVRLWPCRPQRARNLVGPAPSHCCFGPSPPLSRPPAAISPSPTARQSTASTHRRPPPPPAAQLPPSRRITRPRRLTAIRSPALRSQHCHPARSHSTSPSHRGGASSPGTRYRRADVPHEDSRMGDTGVSCFGRLHSQPAARQGLWCRNL